MPEQNNNLPIVYACVHKKDNPKARHWHRCDSEGKVISGAVFTCYLEVVSAYKEIATVEVVEAFKKD